MGDIQCSIFKNCCKPKKKVYMKNTSLNRNGSNQSSRLRYGKLVGRNRKISSRTVNKCFFDQTIEEEEEPEPPAPITLTITASEPAGDGAIIDNGITAQQTLNFSFTLSEAVNNFTAQDIKLVNATVANFQKVVPGALATETYTAEITALKDGLVKVTVDSGSFTNNNGICNNNGFFSYTYDSTGPIFTLTSNDINQQGFINGNNITLSITTNELATTPNLTKFDIIKQNGSNATFGTVTVNAATQKTINNVQYATNWDVDISNIDADGDYEILIDAEASQDIVGNDSLDIDTTSPNKLQFTRDTVQPQVTTIVAEGVNNGDTTNKNQIKLTFTLNKKNTTFDINSLSSFSQTTGNAIGKLHTFKQFDDLNFSVLLDTTVNDTYIVKVVKDSIEDQAGNKNPGTLFFTFTVDKVQPTIDIELYSDNTLTTLIDTSITKITNKNKLFLKFISSKPPLNFIRNIINANNCSIQNFAQIGVTDTYEAELIMAHDELCQVFVDENMFSDTVGNLNTKSNIIEITRDTQKPTITLRTDDIINGVTNKDTITIDIQSDLDVTTLGAGPYVDIRETGTGGGGPETINFITVDSKNFKAIISGLLMNINYTFTQFDNQYQTDSGNLNNVIETIDFNTDNVIPALTISATAIDELGEAARNVNDSDIVYNDSINIKIVSTKKLFGFFQSIIEITNGRIKDGTFQVIAGTNELEYSAEVIANSDGEVIIEIPENKVRTLANNYNIMGVIFSWFSDTTPPIVKLDDNQDVWDYKLNTPADMSLGPGLTGTIINSATENADNTWKYIEIMVGEIKDNGRPVFNPTVNDGIYYIENAGTDTWKFNLKSIHNKDNDTKIGQPATLQFDTNGNFLRAEPANTTLVVANATNRLNYFTNPPTISVFDNNNNFSFGTNTIKFRFRVYDKNNNISEPVYHEINMGHLLEINISSDDVVDDKTGKTTIQLTITGNVDFDFDFDLPGNNSTNNTLSIIDSTTGGAGGTLKLDNKNTIDSKTYTVEAEATANGNYSIKMDYITPKFLNIYKITLKNAPTAHPALNSEVTQKINQTSETSTGILREIATNDYYIEHTGGPQFQVEINGTNDYNLKDKNGNDIEIVKDSEYTAKTNSGTLGLTNEIFNYERDQKNITVGIAANRPNGVNINTGDVTNDLSINLTFTVGNFVTSHNFDQTHVNVTNGTITNFVDNNDNTFSAVLNSTTDGQCIITVNADSFQDKIFNNNIFNQFTWTRDTKPPVISLAAPNIIQHRINTDFVAPNATATDIVNGVPQNPAPVVVVDVSLVNTKVVGDYSITYDSTDNAGNKSVLIRMVRVIDDVDPVITLVGVSPITVELGNIYNDLGVTIVDDSLTVETTTNNVNTNKVGNYEVVYTSVDAYDNTSTLTRLVNVVDTTPPTLTLNGPNPYDIIQGGSYIEFGSTSNDASGQVNTTITHNVNTSVLGNYVVTYTATDINGNQTINTRDVKIFDNVRPIIQITSNTINQNDVTNKNVIDFKFTVSEDSTFVVGDITVVNGTLQNFVDNNNNNTFNVEFVPTADGNCSIKVLENAFVDNSNTPNGNKASNIFSFTRDTTPPNIPTYSYHQIENNGSVTIYGFCELRSNVFLRLNGILISSDFFPTTIFSFNVNLSEGNNNITFYSSDTLGNTSNISDVTNIVIDTTPPNIPEIFNVLVTKFSVNNSSIVFMGNCDASVQIKLYDINKNLLDNVNSDGLGIFNFTVNNITDGNNVFYFTSTDNVGNESNFRRKDVFTDTTAPNAPTVTSLNVVSKNRVKITGMSEVNSLVKVYNGGIIKGYANVNFLGFFEITTSTFTHGSYNLQLTSTDSSNNESLRTGNLNVNIDVLVSNLVEVSSPITPTKNLELTYTFRCFEVGTIHSNYSFITGRNAINGINTITFEVQNSGSYNNIYVQVEDNNGNFSNKLVLSETIVDITDPVVSISETPNTPRNNTTLQYKFTSTEQGTIFYKFNNTDTNGGEIDAGVNTLNLTGIQGVNTLELRVVDALGNDSNLLTYDNVFVDSIVPTISNVTSTVETVYNKRRTFNFDSNENGKISDSNYAPIKNNAVTIGTNSFTIDFANLHDDNTEEAIAGFWFKVEDELGNETGQKNLPSTTVDSRKPKITSWTSTDVIRDNIVGKTQITFDFELNENVKGFTMDDIKITPEDSGYFSSFSGSDKKYSGTFTVNGEDQNITLEIVSGVFQSKNSNIYNGGPTFQDGVHGTFSFRSFTKKPVVVLNGDESVTLIKNTAYTELNAVAQDFKPDGTTVNIVVTPTGTVDNTTDDTYILTYSYTNALGVKSNDVERTVIVVEPPDETAPEKPTINEIIIEGGFITIEGTAEGNSKLKIKDNDTLLTPLDLDATGIFSHKIGPLSQGVHILKFTATDAALNESVETQKTITIDYEFSIGSTNPEIDLLYDGDTGKLSCVYANTSKNYYMDLRFEGGEDNIYINEINTSLTGYNIIDINNYISNNSHIYINNVLGSKIILANGPNVFSETSKIENTDTSVELLEIKKADGTQWVPKISYLANVKIFFSTKEITPVSGIRINFININNTFTYGDLNATNKIKYNGNDGKITLESWNNTDKMPLNMKFIGTKDNAFITNLYNVLINGTDNYKMVDDDNYVEDETIININNILGNKIIFGSGPKLYEGELLPLSVEASKEVLLLENSVGDKWMPKLMDLFNGLHRENGIVFANQSIDNNSNYSFEFVNINKKIVKYV